MLQELKFQVSTAILTILTLAAAISAAINFQQQYRFRLPDDGVVWVDRNSQVEALHVDPRGPAGKNGIRNRDVLLRVNGSAIGKAVEVSQILPVIGAYRKASYDLRRNGVEFTVNNIVIGEAPQDPATNYLYLVGCAYLAIGLFVYLRRGSAHKAQHFYILCLVSFVSTTFHYTGKLNGFDKVIYWGNVGAGLFAPTIFLHFCLTFSEVRNWFRQWWRAALIYLPATTLFAFWAGITSGTLRIGAIPPVELRWLMDRIWLPFVAGTYLIGGAVLAAEYRRTEDPILRQQLKWLRNGTLFGILPFAVLYVIPYTLGALPAAWQRLSVLTLSLIPLTLAWAILRYRLMDVDVIFQRGYAYTLATLAVLAAFYGIVFTLGSIVQKNFKDLGNGGLITVMLIASFLFQPIRNWIQERLDRYFYRERYDYRRTLVEFARELSSETNVPAMLQAIAERLTQTLQIRHLAFFLEAGTGGPGDPAFVLAKSVGLRDRQGVPIQPGADLDLGFLNWPRTQPYLFFERTRHRLDVISTSWPASIRRTIADLDLTYYVPCTVRGRTIAWLGVSRTDAGDFLSSDDVELLQTLSGYVAIALENAALYQSLERKVEEYERLKEFSENIVESINVGILAADFDDRISSWNAQMETLTGVPREVAVGRRLEDLFPAELMEQFARVRGETGIHHIYKFGLKPASMMGASVYAAANGNGAGASLPPAPREAIVNVAIAPLIARDQESIGRLIIFDDITDRAELEQRLVQADKLSSIGLLAAGVAHEVNTPLAVISTYAQMLAKQVANDQQKSMLLDKIARQTFRASEIVNSLLNFSRTSTTEFGEVQLNRVVQETISLLEHQLQKAGIQVSASLDAALLPIHGNAGKLQQVFLNLFLNARDAMEPGGTLTVRTFAAGAGARVEVGDTGHGISNEHIRRIYDPFFTTKQARKGTGLGLAVTYGIVQEHGGSIEVSSQPGQGTKFHLEFPWHKAAAARKPVNA